MTTINRINDLNYKFIITNIYKTLLNIIKLP